MELNKEELDTLVSMLKNRLKYEETLGSVEDYEVVKSILDKISKYA